MAEGQSRTRLLDLTRLVSRLGRGPMTGIDRVEYAYLTRFLAEESPLFALVRSSAGFLLLDRSGCQAFWQIIDGQTPLPRADLLSRLTHRGNPIRARAETAVRELAVRRSSRLGLHRLLRRLPGGFGYFNTGHANLDARVLAGVRRIGGTVTVLVHDTIPLDHPEFARSDRVAGFRRKLAAVSAGADRVIHLSHATRATTEAQFARLGRVPPGLVAPLGVALPAPDPTLLPADLDLTRPYFITLGTIEPRKNHALLLDVWDRLPSPQPQLFIIGNRGWAGAELLQRLDNLPPDGPVRVMVGLPDGAVAALIRGAHALLAPSRAEGFGLPPVEAALSGTAVIATDLAVTRELLGNKAVYLPPDDIYSWMETIIGLTVHPASDPLSQDPPLRLTWAEHFNAVLTDGW